MTIGIEWGRKSVAYERLWDLADVLGVSIDSLFIEARALPVERIVQGWAAANGPRQRRLADRGLAGVSQSRHAAVERAIGPVSARSSALDYT